MHAISLAELASTFVTFATTMLDRKIAPARDATHAYWVHHRSRHDHWSQQLAEHRDSIARTGTSYRTRKWNEILPVLQEVLVTEPLSRTLACFATQLEQRCISDELAPLAHSVLVSHLEARNRCLHLIVFGNGLPVEVAVKLNRIRRQLEDYSDRLLATFTSDVNVDSFCFDTQVVRQARSSLINLTHPQQAGSNSFGGSWLAVHMHLLAHQLWRSLQLDLDWRTSSGCHNHRLSQAVLGMLPVEAFDSLGVPRSNRIHGLLMDNSPESDGTSLDPAQGKSPLNLFFKHSSHTRIAPQRNRKRW